MVFSFSLVHNVFMKTNDEITKENLEESYSFLSKKVLEERSKNYSPILLSFRNEIIRQHYPLSPQDMLNLDLLYFESLKIDGKTYLGREALEEAYSLLQKIETFPEDKFSFYKDLAMDFQTIEDVRKEVACLKEASFLASKIGRRDEAIALKKDVIALVFRFPEEERKEEFPSYEELILQFGKDTGKELFSLEEEEPYILYDTVETNPFYIRLIDKVNHRLSDYFQENPKEFSEQKFNSLKRRFLKEEGLEWNPPSSNPKRISKA